MCELITYGSANGHFYVIMAKYGKNLRQMMRESKYNRFSLKTAVQIGLQLIDQLETLHLLGYVHVDFKPEKVVLRTSNKKDPRRSQLILIDYSIYR
jgi:serine/threonine protein kinase